MRALVLGGAGFIGLHLATRLAATGCEVTAVDDFSRGRDDSQLAALRADPLCQVISADLTDRGAWRDLPRGFDQIYLLAAVVGVRNVVADPARVLRVNTCTVMHLLDWIGPEDRVFFSSTSELYADSVETGLVGVPTAEDAPVLVRDVGAARSAYAISKLAGEAALLHASRAGRCRGVIGRFHNVYGPRMGSDHVIPEMSIRALAGEDPFRVWGSDQSRAFCHVDDAVEAVLRLMETPTATGEIVNIGNDQEETQISELAALILRLAGVKPEIEPLPAPPGSVRRRRPDIRKLRRLTGFTPAVSLEDGVYRTLEWYRDPQGDQCRSER